MPSRTKSSMSIKKTALPRKKSTSAQNTVQEQQVAEKKKEAVQEKPLKKPAAKTKRKPSRASTAKSTKKNSAKTPEDAILQSSAVDPDLENATKPKKSSKKKTTVRTSRTKKPKK